MLKFPFNTRAAMAVTPTVFKSKCALNFVELKTYNADAIILSLKLCVFSFKFVFSCTYKLHKRQRKCYKFDLFWPQAFKLNHTRAEIHLGSSTAFIVHHQNGK